MQRIGVITNKDKDIDLKFTKLLIDDILKKGGVVLFNNEIAIELGIKEKYLSDEEVINCSDIIICLGGDGTFLRVARKVYKYDKPIMGINLGNLGFLTEVDKVDISRAVDMILEDKYTIQNRMMLEANILRKDNTIEEEIALNDIVVSGASLSRILHVNTYINNVYLDSFTGDGVIVASPTGSTAYSLSAGGPIVEPDIDLMILTPICPHTLYSKSFITTGDRVITLEIDENYSYNAIVTMDGQVGYRINREDKVEIRRSNYTIKMAKINSINFFNVLRHKIYNRGESLRRNEV